MAQFSLPSQLADILFDVIVLFIFSKTDNVHKTKYYKYKK